MKINHIIARIITIIRDITISNIIINGADVSSDTLKELADKIVALTQADNGLVSTKVAQSFTAPEKLQARNNIDVYSKAEIGDINTNFVATINTTFSS